MDIQEFKKLQQTQMEIMDEIHRVCCDNGIKYYIIGGTALGAVRHSGFIPWDLDIDIAMPRVDYERFAEVGENQLSNRFCYKSYKNTKGYTRPHALVCINNTLLYTKYSKLNTNEVNYGIYMDIFPLDNAPSSKELQKKQAKQLKFINKLKAIRHGYSFSEKLWKRIIKKSIAKLLFFISIDKMNEKFDRVSRLYENVDSNMMCSMASHYSYDKQCMSSEIYGKPTLVRFEDRQYYAPEKIDEYLTRIYGDYMQLPPEEERRANLSAFEKVVFDN